MTRVQTLRIWSRVEWIISRVRIWYVQHTTSIIFNSAVLHSTRAYILTRHTIHHIPHNRQTRSSNIISSRQGIEHISSRFTYSVFLLGQARQLCSEQPKDVLCLLTVLWSESSAWDISSTRLTFLLDSVWLLLLFFFGLSAGSWCFRRFYSSEIVNIRLVDCIATP